MGLAYYSDMIGGSPPPPAQAHPIGPDAQSRPVTAMRVDRVNGIWTFAGEQPCRADLRWVEVPRDAERDETNFRWVRMTYSHLPSRQDGPHAIRQGDQLSVTEWPYGNGWVTVAKFKAGSHHARRLPAEASADETTLIKAVESLPYDYWETGRYITAGISRPQSPDTRTLNLRVFKVDRLFLLGVCADVQTAVEELLKLDKVRFEIASAEKGYCDRLAPQLLHPQTRQETNSLAWLSLRQALAGPPDNDHIKDGDPVTQLFKFILEDHLYNDHRRRTRHNGHGDLPDDDIPSS